MGGVSSVVLGLAVCSFIHYGYGNATLTFILGHKAGCSPQSAEQTELCV